MTSNRFFVFRSWSSICCVMMLIAIVWPTAHLHADTFDDWSYVAPSSPFHFDVTRLDNNPIIYPDLNNTIGDNINGPSLIRVPDWFENPLGKYYLYFAHHNGGYIRMAYADSLDGNWTVYEPGVLSLDDTDAHGHIASPDVHIDYGNQQIRMYFHGHSSVASGQVTWAALGSEGLSFTANSEILGNSYFRTFEYNGWHYAVSKVTQNQGGILYRSADGLSDFEEGPRIIPNVRHTALWMQDGMLYIFFSRIGDSPEHIMVTRVENLEDDWNDWTYTEPMSVLTPEYLYEGMLEPIEASSGGAADGFVHQLRDPAIFEDEGRLYLLYSVGGESGIAIAQLHLSPEPGSLVLIGVAGMILLQRRQQKR